MTWRFLAMAKKPISVPMVTQPIRLSAAHPMAESVSAKKRGSGSKKMSSAKADLLRRSSLNKQRSLLAGESKNVKARVR